MLVQTLGGVGGREKRCPVSFRQGSISEVLAKYNVLSWIRGFYQDRGENRGALYEAIKAEQLRLWRILHPQGDP